MKKVFFTIFSFFLLLNISAQFPSLVNNGSFEDKISCPTSANNFYLVKDWKRLSSSPDYFHKCFQSPIHNQAGIPLNNFGYQYPRTDSAYAGLIVKMIPTPTQTNVENYREYIQTKLPAPLVVGTEYQLTFYVSVPDFYEYSTDKISGLFSTDSIMGYSLSANALIRRAPQVTNTNGVITDTLNWTKVSGAFVADSSYEYLTIGNFATDSLTPTQTITPGAPGNTAIYFYIEDVDLIEFSPFILGDTIICAGDSTTLTVYNESMPAWIDASNSTIVLSNDSVIMVSPTVTTKYLVYGAVDTTEITVYVNNYPQINLGNEIELCQGDSVVLNVSNSGAAYLWQDNSMDSIFTVNTGGLFSVEVNSNGCISLDSVAVTIVDCDTVVLELPNVFTPNNDGLNDQFLPIKSLGIVQMHTVIYNRWGTLLYETDDLAINWSPIDSSDGTYFWMINYTDIYGENKDIQGIVTLLK